MGKIYFGLLLTLLVSLLVTLAGWHLAQRSLTVVTPVDRELVRDLAENLDAAVEAWQGERRQALRTLAFKAAEPMATNIEEELAKFPGVRGAFLFEGGRQSQEWVLLGAIDSRSPAEVVEEGVKSPLNADRAIVVPEGYFQEVTFGQAGRFENSERSFHAWWYSPLEEVVVLFLIEDEVESAALMAALAEELQGDFARAAEAGELIAAAYRGQEFLGEGPSDRMATVENRSGEFSVRAWERRKVEAVFEWPTLFGATGLALIIAAVGLILFFSQRRMWRDSEERVSFVNRVSHELGTPLTNMTLNLELAGRSLHAKPEMAGRRLEMVREEVARLSRLVSNVLTHSRKHKKARRSTEDCDPHQVIASVLGQFRPALDRRQIELDWQDGEVGRVNAARDDLSQIIWNLISNVEKYAAKGGWLGLVSLEDEGDFVLRVSDRGEGIPSHRRAKIFKPFERVSDSTKEGVSGTGLGLSISRDLARAMQGDLTLLENCEETTFELRIPLKKP